MIELAAVVLMAASTVEIEAQAQRQGQWSLSHRWVNTGGTRQYGAVLADHNETRTYRLCRDGTLSAGAGSRMLSVHVDRTELTGGSVFSLDAGSCLVTRARHLALRYDGPDVSVVQMLSGRFDELDSETLTSYRLELVAPWAMAFNQDLASRHAVVIVNGVPGDYQFCISGSEIGPPVTDGAPNMVAVRLRVDGAPLQAFNSRVSYRQGNCTNFSGSNVVVEAESWSLGIDYYRITGFLYRRVGLIRENLILDD